MTASFDCIVVGSGINGLVCAAMLARKGHKVCVVERESELGGCIKSGEVTLPGFVHDILSGFHPLFVTSPGYAQLGDALHERGLVYTNTAHPTGVLTSGGKSLVLQRSAEANAIAFNALAAGDGDRFIADMTDVENNAGLTFSLLGNDLWTRQMAWTLTKETWARKPAGMADYFGHTAQTCRDWLTGNYSSRLVQALLAPWVLHTGLGPDSPISGYMGKVIAFSMQSAGMPVVQGGCGEFIKAFERLILDHDGTIMRSTEVSEIITDSTKASGVRCSDGRELAASRGVFCSVTPDVLYNKLLRNVGLPEAVTSQATEFRFGRAGMQIHLALDGPPAWPSEDLASTVMVHLCDGIDNVSRAVTEANAGLLPACPTIVVGQPMTNDPSRAPAGKWILWLQLQELPRIIAGDAAGEIAIGPNGAWSQSVTGAYADRVIRRLCDHLPGLDAQILHRTVIAPPQLEEMNCNLVGGDPYSGDCAIDQSFLWRPLKAAKNHRTPVAKLFHIGASTHPGPGLGGVSGYIAANYV